ncbi:MAG: PLDc N-terminal domain-containing protein [Myxococcales bacterium]|nr:PLDc N-terminal domain-containing protein [Myxococcales bacterium]
MLDLLHILEHFSAAIAAAASLALAMLVSAHVVLTRRDSRTAVSWVGLVWLVPVLGSVLYVALGINRIRRRATAMRLRVANGDASRVTHAPGSPDETAEAAAHSTHDRDADPSDGDRALQRDPLVTVGDNVTHSRLTERNRVIPLEDGDAAYPAMLQAIEAATETIALSSYIFDHDPVGLQFVHALVAAKDRGVNVRVLIDAVGARYSWPKTSVVELLTARGVQAKRFNPTRSPVRLRYMNLRSHRKVLVVDGCKAFTGGMNIRIDCMLGQSPAHPTRDLHFQLEGPVVTQLWQSFGEDWHFSTGELLPGAGWQESHEPGHTAARAILDGPDEDFDKLRRMMLGALSVARRRVCITTPYFLPDPDIVAALEVAVLRGVTVDIVLPAQSNLRLVQWAMTHGLLRILETGCRVWQTGAPFDHTKLMVVDERWALVGSGNWDPRSLRLNFELNVELYDAALAATLTQLVESKMAGAHRLTQEELLDAPLWERLRNGVASLGTPYL